MRLSARGWVLTAVLLSACASVRVPSHPLRVKDGATIELAGMGPCGARSPTLAPSRPLAILVHGVHSTGAGLASLADAFRADGRQAVCFRYDPRASLLRTAEALRTATAELAHALRAPDILLFGHSQGGLVARAALVAHPHALPPGHYRLVTVSSPFAGIRIARSCSSLPYHIASLGVSYAVCRAISGDSWNEIHPRSTLVRSPAALDPQVDAHVLVVTDERDTCRRYSVDGRACLQDDYVFSTGEQHNRTLERDPRVIAAPLSAGHVEVLGAHGPPRKLLEVLERHGLFEQRGAGTGLEQQSAKRGW
ncbi:MAG TPA: hypothetical protein VI299_24450 [Polyangiales bacterium]